MTRTYLCSKDGNEAALIVPARQIKRISGVEVREAREEIKTTNCTVVQTFANGTVVQVYLLACNVPTQTWSGNGSPDHQGVMA